MDLDIKTFSVDTRLVREHNYKHELLLETAHAFSHQYDIASKCANAISKLLLKGGHKTTVDVSEFNSPIKKVEILLTKSVKSFRGQLTRVSKEGTITVELSLNCEEDIIGILTHELMHTAILLNRNASKQELNDMPSWYSQIGNVFRTENVSRETYLFARALYTAYYQEAQALISQTWAQVKSEIPKYQKYGMEKDNDLFNILFANCDTAKDFSNNCWICSEIMKRPKLAQSISDELKPFGINISQDEIIKDSTKIKQKSQSALYSAMNNAYIHWLDYEDF